MIKSFEIIKLELINKGFEYINPKNNSDISILTLSKKINTVGNLIVKFYEQPKSFLTVVLKNENGKNLILKANGNERQIINKVLNEVDKISTAFFKVFENVFVFYGDFSEKVSSADIDFIELGLTDDNAVKVFLNELAKIDKKNIRINTSNAEIVKLINTWYLIEKGLNKNYIIEWKNKNLKNNDFKNISNFLIENLESNIKLEDNIIILNEYDDFINLVNNFNSFVAFLWLGIKINTRIIDKYEIFLNEKEKIISPDSDLVLIKEQDVWDMAGVIIFNIPIRIHMTSKKYPTIFIDNIRLQWVDWSGWGFELYIDGEINDNKIKSNKKRYFDEINVGSDADSYHNDINKYALKLIDLFTSNGFDNFLFLIEKHLERYENNLSQLLLDYLVESPATTKEKFLS